MPDTCTIDDAIKTLQSLKAVTGPPSALKIVVLDRGWVFVGRYEEEDGQCTLHEASVIRKWGTTKGLPELQPGPTESTILDACSLPVRFTKEAVLFMLDTGEGWS